LKRPITTTEDQSTTFIELFFDLVFVYAVTQTVSLVHEELSWAGVAHAVIVFWLVWWAWTQLTWALNSADTTHPGVEAVMLVATAIAFLMAVTVPDAFGDAGGWFAATYIAVRVVGLALYGPGGLGRRGQAGGRAPLRPAVRGRPGRRGQRRRGRG